ncbi:MAG: alpha-galactosidase [Clostridia bacterium]|nr:alpha-galactosidase [Clostridia bacterium]
MKNEMILRNKMLGYTCPEKVPVTFSFDGLKTEGLSSEFRPTVKSYSSDSAVNVTEITAIAAKGMILTVRETKYADFPVVEWGADMTNFGKSDSEILSDFAISAVLKGSNPMLISGSGDTRNDELFRRFNAKEITEKISISPAFCRGADGASPFMTLNFSEYSVKLGIGWPGKWKMVFEPVSGGVKFTLSQERCYMKIHPGETMRTPNITALFYEGDENKGTNLWRRFFLKHILPVGKNGDKISPIMFLHTHMIGGFAEFEGITTENQLEAIETYIKRGLKPDCWWIDAGWYPCEHRWWNVGDWTPNPEQLPDGFKPISDKLHENGIELLVWFEPERAMAGSKMDFLHPEWCLKAHNNEGEEESVRLLDYSDPECFEFILNLLDAHIKTGGIDIYRQDFNFTPDKYFIENEAEDRIGAMENLHMQALLRLYDELRLRNPGLIIDNCAAGGTRNEMDMMRRSVPMQYTDMHIDSPEKRVFHYYEMFSWIPYFRAHAKQRDTRFPNNRNLDDYSYLCAMAPAITMCLDYFEGEGVFNTARKMLPIWRNAAEYELKGDYYKLTSPDTGWFAVQFHDPTDGSGFIEVIRTEEAEEAHINVRPFILPHTKYVFKNPLTGDIKRGDSTGLDGGFTFYNPKRKGEIWFYTSQKKDII